MTQKQTFPSEQYEVAEATALNDLTKQLVVQWKKWGLQRHTYLEWKAIVNYSVRKDGAS